MTLSPRRDGHPANTADWTIAVDLIDGLYPRREGHLAESAAWTMAVDLTDGLYQSRGGSSALSIRTEYTSNHVVDESFLSLARHKQSWQSCPACHIQPNWDASRVFPAATYLGCFLDYGSSRTLGLKIDTDSSMTTEVSG